MCIGQLVRSWAPQQNGTVKRALDELITVCRDVVQYYSVVVDGENEALCSDMNTTIFVFGD